MTFAPSLADAFRAFAEVTHELASRAEAAEAELAKERQLSANLGLDNRALQDRLKERDEVIARQGRERTDTDRLVRRLRDTSPVPAGTERAHTGPPGRCQCGVVHGHGQAVAMTSRIVRDDGRDRTETRP